MVSEIDTLPEQICFPSDDGQVMFCNWVKHPKKIGYAILSSFGKWIPFPIDRTKKRGDEETYRQFFAAIPETGYHHIRNAALVSMLYDTFARVNEILPMRMSQINDDRLGAMIMTEKVFDEDERRVFWRKETKTYLLRWLEEREKIFKKIKAPDGGELFIAVGGGNCDMAKPYRQLKYESAYCWFKKYSNLAGLSTVVNPHALRHKGAVEMATQDYDPYAIASILGHKTIESSLNYARLYGEDLKRKYYGIKKGA